MCSCSKCRASLGASKKKPLISAAGKCGGSQAYERLRELALGGSSGGGWGMHLFITRGMSAWLVAQTVEPQARPIRNVVANESCLPDSSRQHLVATMAGMVMSAIEMGKEGLLCRS